MNLYIFSDESGVFDQKHNDFFVYGGIIFLGNEQLRSCNMKTVKIKDSKSNTLIRIADIIANKIFYDTVHQIHFAKDQKMFIKVFP